MGTIQKIEDQKEFIEKFKIECRLCGNTKLEINWNDYTGELTFCCYVCGRFSKIEIDLEDGKMQK